MKRISLLLFAVIVIVAAAVPTLSVVPAQPPDAGAKKRPMTLDDLFKFKRVSDPQISPDGKWVVYTVGTVDDVATNKTSSTLWLASTDGKTRRQLTNTAKKDRQARWSPDGKSILFVSTRGGSPQLWIIDLDGGEARQLTKVSTGVSEPTWSRDGKRIAFVSTVWPEFSDKPFKESDKLNKERMDEREGSPVKAKVFTRLFYRHWDEYVEDKRMHLFVCEFADGKASEPRDVTPGDYDAYPTSDTFATTVNYTFSPDGSHLVFTAPPKENEAWSTNYDIWRIAVDGKGKPENLTKDNLAADGGPQFSPDGKKLAYRAQKKAGYEADAWELTVVDCNGSGAANGKSRSVTDYTIEEFAWDADSHVLWFTLERKGFIDVFLYSFKSGFSQKVVERIGSLTSLSVTQGQQLVFTLATLRAPNEIMSWVPSIRDVVPQNLSRANSELDVELDTPKAESVTVKGAGGTPMQMWILKPPNFDPAKKWPVVYIVHGGPQMSWVDGWSYRWNPMLWAAQGYVVALPNPRGSTGFGQKYVDEITGDWGGKCYIDLMKGVDYLETLPYVDKDRIGAAGASFGGYMMNWFAVNTPRFKTLITHCSVWNFDSMYATTDEIWFDEWEHGGPPWGKNRESYEKHSPHRYAGNLGKYKTPMLVIHNDYDFRCPIGQGHELFTSLQRQGVPSKMINFPDEGHWVLKPANSRYWHQEVFGWLKKYVPPGGR
ncbi:MAG TPA: S9 family peptidase [Gemmataceae bacterium]|nr:S9 family peptidase [Gemmataceae bacterium]